MSRRNRELVTADQVISEIQKLNKELVEVMNGTLTVSRSAEVKFVEGIATTIKGYLANVSEDIETLLSSHVMNENNLDQMFETAGNSILKDALAALNSYTPKEEMSFLGQVSATLDSVITSAAGNLAKFLASGHLSNLAIDIPLVPLLNKIITAPSNISSEERTGLAAVVAFEINVVKSLYALLQDAHDEDAHDEDAEADEDVAADEDAKDAASSLAIDVKPRAVKPRAVKPRAVKSPSKANSVRGEVVEVEDEDEDEDEDDVVKEMQSRLVHLTQMSGDEHPDLEEQVTSHAKKVFHLIQELKNMVSTNTVSENDDIEDLFFEELVDEMKENVKGLFKDIIPDFNKFIGSVETKLTSMDEHSNQYNAKVSDSLLIKAMVIATTFDTNAEALYKTFVAATTDPKSSKYTEAHVEFYNKIKDLVEKLIDDTDELVGAKKFIYPTEEESEFDELLKEFSEHGVNVESILQELIDYNIKEHAKPSPPGQVKSHTPAIMSEKLKKATAQHVQKVAVKVGDPASWRIKGA